MIDAAIEHLAARLNLQLRSAFATDEDLVVVSNLCEQDGSAAPDVANKLAVFLVNLEQEAAARTAPAVRVAGGGLSLSSAPPLQLNLYMMVAANFHTESYVQGLRYLSEALSFFQCHPVFDQQASPDLPAPIERLVLDIKNQSLEELGTLWGSLGGHYRPSILYKVRYVLQAADDTNGHCP
ncbi:MAG: DUF4255 domain-containing protein [Pseudomonadota bacterium]